MEKKISNSKHCSPLRYPGGKSCIFPFVSKVFYENEIVGMNYAEPYAGGAGLALKLLFDEYVNKIYINDFDRSIFSFWLNILNRTDEFCEWIKKVKVDIATWKKYKEMQQFSDELDSFELAKSTFFLNRTNISGVIKGGVIGGIEQKGNYKIDARFNKPELTARINKVSLFKERIILSNLDGISFVKKLDNKREDIFIYIDPPYVQKGADLYMNFYIKKDHERLAKYVAQLNKRWMVSYDNNDFILNLYSESKKVIYQLAQCASNRIGDEVIIFSDQIEYINSMSSLQSPIEYCSKP